MSSLTFNAKDLEQSKLMEERQTILVYLLKDPSFIQCFEILVAGQFPEVWEQLLDPNFEILACRLALLVSPDPSRQVIELQNLRHIFQRGVNEFKLLIKDNSAALNQGHIYRSLERMVERAALPF
jgi:hypothetical protein